ncbi:MAG: DUF6265 family protein, partial [Vicinamibacterales bacterium]
LVLLVLLVSTPRAARQRTDPSRPCTSASGAGAGTSPAPDQTAARIDAARKVARATIAEVAWISGVWIGTSGATTVEEHWTPPAAGAMLGIGRTIRKNVMSAFEFLCIAERDGGLVYTAMPNGRTPPTDFTLTAVTADSATFENPTHDFPKRIRYTRRPDGTLETAVSGDAMQPPQVLLLERQK